MSSIEQGRAEQRHNKEDDALLLAVQQYNIKERLSRDVAEIRGGALAVESQVEAPGTSQDTAPQAPGRDTSRISTGAVARMMRHTAKRAGQHARRSLGSTNYG